MTVRFQTPRPTLRRPRDYALPIFSFFVMNVWSCMLATPSVPSEKGGTATAAFGGGYYWNNPNSTVSHVPPPGSPRTDRDWQISCYFYLGKFFRTSCGNKLRLLAVVRIKATPRESSTSLHSCPVRFDARVRFPINTVHALPSSGALRHHLVPIYCISVD